jgi:DNA (cytosine-5)-methyltransferase 1
VTGPRIGSICSGTGALDMAVHEVIGAETSWFCQYEPPDKDGRPDRWQFASRILAHHWPDVPNHGDITIIDWTQVEKVEWVIAGWPCENMSLAGRREGLVAGVQSGLWFDVVKAIRAQQAMRRPGEPGPFIFLENVRGLLSARADSDVEPCPWCMGDAQGQPVLRALGAVLGDLAELGFDAEWTGLPASGVGACHERWREFVLAWPSDADCPRLEGRRLPGAAPQRSAVAADPAVFGHERSGPAWQRRNGPADSGETAADTNGGGWGRRPRQHRRARPEERLAADIDWGVYTQAIRRHEAAFGRPAPRPTQLGQSGNEQLSPRFTEWMMGLPAGHVTDVPRPEGMSDSAFRNACITACGKGVVPAQAAYALRLLLERARGEVAA